MPICKRCLLSESGQFDELYETLMGHVSAIPADNRVADNEYHRRLDICKNCDNLTDGMCVLCGCYVELRAAIKAKQCVKYFW